MFLFNKQNKKVENRPEYEPIFNLEDITLKYLGVEYPLGKIIVDRIKEEIKIAKNND